MAKLQTIGFDGKLHNKISKYAERRNLSFSKAVCELARFGLAIYEEAGSVDMALIEMKMRLSSDALQKAEADKRHLYDILKTMMGLAKVPGEKRADNVVSYLDDYVRLKLMEQIRNDAKQLNHYTDSEEAKQLIEKLKQSYKSELQIKESEKDNESDKQGEDKKQKVEVEENKE